MEKDNNNNQESAGEFFSESGGSPPTIAGYRVHPAANLFPLMDEADLQALAEDIKKNGLQDKVQRRNIHADDKLKPVFGGKKTVNMFEMTKLVNKHLG